MKILCIIIALIMDFFLKVFFNMKNKTLLFCVFIELSAILFFSDLQFFAFFWCFLLVGILKLISKRLRKKSDVSEYLISNFVYSAGLPLLFSYLQCFTIQTNMEIILNYLVICSLAALIADTASSEVGQWVKCKTYSIISLKKTTQGIDGGVSVNGFVGSVICILVYLALFTIFYNLNWHNFILIFFISEISNLADSFLGATIQKKGYLNNEQVNFVAILLSDVLFLLFKVII